MWLQTLLWGLWKTWQPKKQSRGRVLFLIKFAKQFLFKRSALACIHLTARLCLAHCSSGYCDHLEINGMVKTTGTIMEKQLNRSIRGTQKGTFNKDTCWLNLLDLIFWLKMLKRNLVISCSCQDNAASHPCSANSFSFSIFKSFNDFIKKK